MRKDGGEAKKATLLVDARGLDSRDFMPAKAFAHNIQSARQRGVAEGALCLARERRADGSNERFLRISELNLRLRKGSRYGGDRITGALHWRPPPAEDQS